MSENEEKRFGRRAGSTVVYAGLLLLIYGVTVFKSLPLEYFETPIKYLTFALAFVIGGLTATDIILKK